MFTEKELAYLDAQPLARLATVAPDLQPDVSAVSFQLRDGEFFISGYNLTKSRKYKNIAGGNPKVALIVDDLESVDPWIARGIRIYGSAAGVKLEGRDYLRITPEISWSWNIEAPAFVAGKFVTHRTEHGQRAHP